METSLKRTVTSRWKSLTSSIARWSGCIVTALKSWSTSATTTLLDNLADEYCTRYEHFGRSPKLWKNRHLYGKPFGWFLGIVLWIGLKKQSGLAKRLRT